MTSLEIYTIVINNDHLRFASKGASVICDDSIHHCTDCPLYNKLGSSYCLPEYIAPILEDLPSLEFQYKASK